MSAAVIWEKYCHINMTILPGLAGMKFEILLYSHSWTLVLKPHNVSLPTKIILTYTAPSTSALLSIPCATAGLCGTINICVLLGVPQPGEIWQTLVTGVFPEQQDQLDGLLVRRLYIVGRDTR
jgi:hypothetical protein